VGGKSAAHAQASIFVTPAVRSEALRSAPPHPVFFVPAPLHFCSAPRSHALVTSEQSVITGRGYDVLVIFEVVEQKADTLT